MPPNPGLMTMAISATRVYAETPDWNQQRADGDVTFAGDEGWEATLQTVVDMNEAGCYQEGAAGGGFDAITQGITQGTSLSAFVPGGAATELMNATPGLELNIQPFPTDGGDPYLLASPNYALAVSAESDDATKQAAQDFLAWLAEPENAAEFVEVSGGVAITGPDENINPGVRAGRRPADRGQLRGAAQPGVAEPRRLRRAGGGCPGAALRPGRHPDHPREHGPGLGPVRQTR